jgi:hypothetical protein
VIALLRYQAAILFRSHRWVFPLVSYALLISVAGADEQGSRLVLAQQQAAVSDGLDWSAAMLLPVVALLTRSMLTAEPGAARACVAAAAGPRKAQLAVLITGLAGGAVLGLVGAASVVVTTGGAVHAILQRDPGLLAATLGAGLGKAVICVFVGSAVGTFCNPPVIRHQTVALLSTVAAVLVGLVSSVSPASAALRGSGAAIQAARWPAGTPFVVAAGLLIVSWLVSAVLAARRGS